MDSFLYFYKNYNYYDIIIKRICYYEESSNAFLFIVLMFSLASCYCSNKKIQEIDEMFKSFKQNNNYVLLTCYELVIYGKHYELSSIKYNDRKLNIVFLEEEGFYSYTVDETGKNLFV